MHLIVSTLLLGAIVVLVGAVFAAVLHTARPAGFPRNVPVVPLWLQVRSRIGGMPRVVFYERHVRPLAEKHGAVALWLETQWTVVVTRPALVVQVLKNAAHDLEKHGTWARRPHSNGGFIFGVNIIDSNDPLHATFADIVRPALVGDGGGGCWSLEVMRAESAKMVRRLLGEDRMEKTRDDDVDDDETKDSAAGPSSIDDIIWRWSVTIFSHYFLGTRHWPLSYRETSARQITMMQSVGPFAKFRAMFAAIDFPSWRQACYRKGTALVRQLDDTLVAVASAAAQQGSDKLAARLIRARDDGLLSDFHLRSNLKQLLIAGHENTEAVFQSAMYELARNPNLQALLHDEVTRLLPVDYSAAELDRLPLLAAIAYESLRLFPPLGQLTNRRTVGPMELIGAGSDSESTIFLPAGIMVGWSAVAVQTSPAVWGDTAAQFDPFRWGTDLETVRRTARARQARGHFVPFSMHARRCLGSGFALTQLKTGLCELVRGLEWRLAGQKEHNFDQSFITGMENSKFVFKKRN